MNSVANGKIREHTPFRRGLRPAGSGRQRHGARRGARWPGTARGGARTRPRMEHAYWGTAYDDAAIARRDRDSGAVEQRRCRGRRSTDEADAVPRHGRAHCRRRRRRLVPGAHGVGRARARQPQHPRRSAAARHARRHQPEDQVPRAVPAVRAVDPRGGASASTSSTPCPTRSCSRCIRCGPRQARRHPGGHARGRLGPPADGQPRRATRAIWALIARLRRAHRRARLAQHVVQRERADRRTPRAGARLLSADRHGRARHGHRTCCEKPR